MWFFYRRETSSYKFLLNSHLFDLRFCDSCGVQSRDGPLIEISFYRQSTSKPSKGISTTIGYRGICPSLALQNCHGRYHHSRKPLLRYIKENKLGLVLSICFILHCACIFFSPIKLHRQDFKWLTGRVLKIPSSEPWVATLRFGMGSHCLPLVMDFWEVLYWEQKNHSKQLHP